MSVKTLRDRLLEARQLWHGTREADLEARIRAARLLGAAHRGLGQWADALAVFGQMRDECLSAGQVGSANEFELWIANIHYHRGDYSRSLDLVREVIVRERALGNEWQAASISAYYLAKPLLIIDELAEHEAAIVNAIDTFLRLKPPVSVERMPFFLCYLAEGYLETGRADEAQRIAVKQVTAFREQAIESGIPFALMAVGRAAIHTGDLDLACRSLTEALAIYSSQGREGFVCDCLVGLSRTARTGGDLSQSWNYIQQALAEARLGPRLTEGLADTLHLNAALIEAYAVASRLGHQADAAAYLAEARNLAATHGRRLMLRHLSEEQAQLPT